MTLVLPMRRVVMVTYDGVQTLDVSGPAEVFAVANAVKQAAYRIEFAMVGGGLSHTTSGMVVCTRDLLQLSPQADDTVIVAGASEAGTQHAMQNAELRGWLQAAHERVERIASVCTGLIEFGCTPAKLLNKLRVEHACVLLATSDLSAKTLTALCGFGSSEHLRRVFEEVMGMTPQHYRALHARAH